MIDVCIYLTLSAASPLILHFYILVRIFYNVLTNDYKMSVSEARINHKRIGVHILENLCLGCQFPNSRGKYMISLYVALAKKEPEMMSFCLFPFSFAGVSQSFSFSLDFRFASMDPTLQCGTLVDKTSCGHCGVVTPGVQMELYS